MDPYEVAYDFEQSLWDRAADAWTLETGEAVPTPEVGCDCHACEVLREVLAAYLPTVTLH